MKISVIIPVYNAEKYVEQAVESALAQEEVSEVILAEDGSPDGSLDVCKRLAEKYEKVFLYQHPNGENRGAGETRNLAIKKSSCEFVAFLDADDFFLPNRFEITKKVFENNPEADGVYEAIGVYFENEKEREEWFQKSGKELTTLSEKVKPKKLFPFLALAGKGHFSLNGLTVKKKVFDEDLGLFSKELKISQDTHFCLKLSIIKNLLPGSINKAVAMRRVHSENRITRTNVQKMSEYQNILWTSLLKWSKNKKIGFSEKSLIFFMQFHCARMAKNFKNDISDFKIKFDMLTSLLMFTFSHPLRGIPVFGNIFYFTLRRLF